MKLEKSCGAVILDTERRHVLLVRHNMGHWGFPKGHMEHAETEEETALREIKEETALDVRILPGFRHVISYSPGYGIRKDVVYFLAAPLTRKPTAQPSEIAEVRWCVPEEAKTLITYESDRAMLDAALAASL